MNPPIRVAGIGACVMDTLFTVPEYPAEDTKLRAADSRPAGGGPVATGLVAAAKLGIGAAYLGVLAEDAGGAFLTADFARYGVNTDYISRRAGFRSFTSCIWLSEKSKSRTIVFDKGDLPPLALNEQQLQVIRDAEILMLDGNELEAAIAGAKTARAAGTKVLYDAGGVYPGVERLLPHVDLLIPAEEFALKTTGCADAESAARKLFAEYRPQVVVVTCGAQGGVYFDGAEIYRYPCYPVEAVDSNGAGDVFHGAFAAGVCRGYDYKKCCHFASAVSALKCTGIGARASVPEFAAVQEFLRERGFAL